MIHHLPRPTLCKLRLIKLNARYAKAATCVVSMKVHPAGALVVILNVNYYAKCQQSYQGNHAFVKSVLINLISKKS